MSKKKRKQKYPVPTPEDAYRCVEFRKQSKRGIPNRKEDYEWVISMFRRYPEWYAETEKQVFNETVPFGSKVRRD